MYENLKAMHESMVKLQGDIRTLILTGGDDWETTHTVKTAELKSLQARYKAAQEVEALEIPDEPKVQTLQALKSLPNPDASGGVTSEKKAISMPGIVAKLGTPEDIIENPFFYAAKAAMSKDEKGFRELYEAFENDFEAMKALSTTSSPLGQWMLPPTMSDVILDVLRDALVFDKLKAQFWTLPTRQMNFPKQLSDATGYWLAENTAITPSDFTGGSYDLSLKDVGAGMIVPNNLLNTTIRERVNQRVQDTLVAKLRRAMEIAYFTGVGAVPSGSNNTGAQPRGLLNISGVNVFNVGAEVDGTTGKKTNGGIPTIADFSRAMSMIEADNVEVNDDSFAWVARLGMRDVFRTMADLEGRPYFIESLSNDNSPDRLYGHPVFYTNALPNNITTGAKTDTSYIFGGVWRHFVIADSGQIAVDASNQAGDSFWKNQTYFRAIASCDCNVEYPEAFVVIKGVRFSDK